MCSASSFKMITLTALWQRNRQEVKWKNTIKFFKIERGSRQEAGKPGGLFVQLHRQEALIVKSRLAAQMYIQQLNRSR